MSVLNHLLFSVILVGRKKCCYEQNILQFRQQSILFLKRMKLTTPLDTLRQLLICPLMFSVKAFDCFRFSNGQAKEFRISYYQLYRRIVNSLYSGISASIKAEQIVSNHDWQFELVFPSLNFTYISFSRQERDRFSLMLRIMSKRSRLFRQR